MTIIDNIQQNNIQHDNKYTTLKPFQPGLVFAGKAVAYPSEAPLRCFPLG
jgi:hypothetical protein